MASLGPIKHGCKVTLFNSMKVAKERLFQKLYISRIKLLDCLVSRISTQIQVRGVPNTSFPLPEGGLMPGQRLEEYHFTKLLQPQREELGPQSTLANIMRGKSCNGRSRGCPAHLYFHLQCLLARQEREKHSACSMFVVG